MTISYEWLLEYLPQPVPLPELQDILTSIGLEVEGTETAEAVKGSLAGLVIGHVLSCVPHENADRLRVTTVDTGTGDPLQIVCGAPNVAAGQKVVVAPVGCTVHPTTGEAFEIKKSKIRGVESQGMICAEDEIGLGHDHAGILILPEDAPVGTDAKTYFQIGSADTAIHIGLTPNRSDAMSHIGVARDVCAYLSHHGSQPAQVKLPEPELAESDAPSPINISIQSPEACRRYAGLLLEHIRVAESPEWLRRRLQTIGVRPINNIVDVTNYVLHETGQPLHAFDADAITTNEVSVRFLAEGTPFTTLDGTERKLSSHDLMICNGAEPMCLAGVFGGKGSGVSERTTRVFLESAYFDPQTIRKTSLAHGLRTDAATHFEKSVDINLVYPALRRAAALISELSGGMPVGRIDDQYPSPLTPPEVRVEYAFIDRLCGKAYAPEAVQRILRSLGFEFRESDERGFTAIVPSNKSDVSQPADIVEEILRIDGLNNIPISTEFKFSVSAFRGDDRNLQEKMANLLSGNGFHEIVTNSIVNSKFYPGRTDLVTMLNSLSSELDTLRPSLLESGLEVIQHNANRKMPDVLLYELGKTYHQQEPGRYSEQRALGLWCTGSRTGKEWSQPGRPADLYFLKGILDQMIRLSGIQSISTETKEDAVQYLWRRQPLASVFVVPDERLRRFELKQPVYFASIDWAKWLEAAADRKIRYQEVPKFPSVRRDLSLVLDRSVSYGEVELLTRKTKAEGLQEFGLFDLFESDKLGAGKKALAINYTFQLADRTLTDQEIDKQMERLAGAYKEKLGAQIRG